MKSCCLTYKPVFALKYDKNFIIHQLVSYEWEDEKNWFLKLWFLKLLRPPLIQFSKFNNFLWVCWFLGKNLSNFVPLVWKLQNPYCHKSKCFPLKIMVTKTQMMVITKLQHIIILKHMSKRTLFLTNTFNVAMFYIIDYIFVKQFRLILQRTNQMKVVLVFTKFSSLVFCSEYVQLYIRNLTTAK